MIRELFFNEGEKLSMKVFLYFFCYRRESILLNWNSIKDSGFPQSREKSQSQTARLSSVVYV